MKVYIEEITTGKQHILWELENITLPPGFVLKTEGLSA